MAQIQFQITSTALPPIKLDGKVYVVISGTYQRMKNERIITARYTSSGGIDLQVQNTGKHRWKMTLMVPLATANVVVEDSPFSTSDMGTLSNLQTTLDKVAPLNLLSFFDISSYWDFSGDPDYSVYVDTSEMVQPNKDDIGVWQVPISLWGYDYS